MGGPRDICVPQWYTGPLRRISIAWLNDEVPVRGKPAPMIWIEEPGWGFDAVWPMLYVFGGLGFEVWFFLFFSFLPLRWKLFQVHLSAEGCFWFIMCS